MAATIAWRTFTTCRVNRDGSGYVEVRRGQGGGERIHHFEFGPEGQEGTK